MINVAILTISDRVSRNERKDETGPAIRKFITASYPDYKVIKEIVSSDEYSEIYQNLQDLIENEHCDLILTNGGTGFSNRDNTPEVTRELCDKLVPGICEKMRYESSKITDLSYLSRAVAGIKNNSLIINLPGSPKAAVENLSSVMSILSHGLKVLKSEVSDCVNELKNSRRQYNELEKS